MRGRTAAPEVLDPYLEFSAGYGPEVDLWALGVVLYSMLAGFPPFYNESNPALVRQIRKGEFEFHSPYWDNISAAAKELVSGLLVVDPARRFTVHQCLEHPWIHNAGEASSKKLHRHPLRRPLDSPLARNDAAAKLPVCILEFKFCLGPPAR
jgi:serine/threonine protein kinase